MKLRLLAATLATGGILAATIVAPAQAWPIWPDYEIHNAKSSTTGAVLHGVTNGHFVKTVVVRQGKWKRFQFKASTKHSFGVKVWKPSRTRLRVYEDKMSDGRGWIRSHNYRCSSPGRDVWVAKNDKVSDAVQAYKVRITPC